MSCDLFDLCYYNAMSRRKRKTKTAFQKVREQVDREFKHYSLEELTRLAESPVATDRFFAVEMMGKQTKDKLVEEYFQLCRKLAGDPESDIHWQAMIYLIDELEKKSEEIWEVIAELGDSSDEDIRTAVACVLLEDLLDFDYDTYFPKVKEAVRKGRYRFINTLSYCWFDDMSGPNYKKAQNFIRHAKRGINPEAWK